MTYVVVWHEYSHDVYALHYDPFYSIEAAETFCGKVHEVIDHERREGKEVIIVYESVRELYPHATGDDAVTLREYPADEE